MASNALPEKLDRLFPLADDMEEGLNDLEVALNIKQNTKLVLGAALTAARAAEAAYGNAKVAKKTANAAVIAADKAARVFIGNARKRLTKFFGESYSEEWGAAGWPNGSTGVPTNQAERYSLVHSLILYFTNHPAHESADMDATAAIATTLHQTLTDTRAELTASITASITAMGVAKVARDNAVAHLRVRMEGLISELAIALTDDDPRWHRFGLSRPADEETPEAPDVMALVGGVPGTLLGDWDDALRAEYYRVWIFIVGTDTEFRPVANPSDSDVTLSGLPSGATVKVRVTTVNDAGESAPGPEAEAVVP